MKNWLTNLFANRTEETNAPAERLDLQKEIQTLRVELDLRAQTLDHLKQEIERLRARQAQLVDETASTRLEALFTDLAGPASQIMTQAELLENQGKPVQAQDVMTVARRILRALERHGVSFDGQIGQQVLFDPNQHTRINAERIPQPGQPVTVRFVGVKYRGRYIHKAVVE